MRIMLLMMMMTMMMMTMLNYGGGLDAQVRRIRVVGSDAARHLGGLLDAKGPPVGIARRLETLPRHC
jgi:hypothetical protein